MFDLSIDLSMFTSLVVRNERSLAYCGGAFLSYYLLKISYHLWKAVKAFYLAPFLRVEPSQLGSWAVVTGATDGIGKAYAQALARRGVNVVLVSRSKQKKKTDKLRQTAEELKSAFKVDTRIIPVDFSEGVEIYDTIKCGLEGLDIGVLVNNVGMLIDHPEYFHLVENRDQVYKKMLHVNIFSLTFMSSIVLPKMVKKQKGAIINIGSVGGYGSPLFSVYSATKSYVDSLSQNLHEEYASKGIIVQSVTPHMVVTKMVWVSQTSYFIPSPSDYAESALSTLGLASVTTGYPAHWVAQSFIDAVIPKCYYRKMVKNIMVSNKTKILKEKSDKRE